MTDENPRTIRDEPGEELSRDPAATFLTQPGGLGPAFSDFVLYGVFNGAFARGPDFPANNIDPWNAAGSNFMPNWRFVQSSNTNITALQVRDTASPSGSNLRFTFDNTGNAADEAFMEQIIPIGGSRSRVTGHSVRATVLASFSGGSQPTAKLAVQYLNVGGTIVGNEMTDDLALASGVATYIQVNAHADDASSPPANAFYLRIRAGVRRASLATNATGTIDYADIRADHAAAVVRIGEYFAPSSYSAGYISQVNGAFNFQPGASGSLGASLDGVLGRFYTVALSVSRDVSLGGDITPTELSAATNDWNPTNLDRATIIRASSDANRNLSGIVAPDTNRWLRIYNVGGFNISLLHDSTSTAANRFLCPNSATFTLNPNDSADLWYDDTDERWRVLGN